MPESSVIFQRAHRRPRGKQPNSCSAHVAVWTLLEKRRERWGESYRWTPESEPSIRDLWNARIFSRFKNAASASNAVKIASTHVARVRLLEWRSIAFEAYREHRRPNSSKSGHCGLILSRPRSAMRGRWSSFVNRVVRSTNVPNRGTAGRRSRNCVSAWPIWKACAKPSADARRPQLSEKREIDLMDQRPAEPS